jgi:hypothetical protein
MVTAPDRALALQLLVQAKMDRTGKKETPDKRGKKERRDRKARRISRRHTGVDLTHKSPQI